jgi:hypothetical protein
VERGPFSLGLPGLFALTSKVFLALVATLLGFCQTPGMIGFSFPFLPPLFLSS